VLIKKEIFRENNLNLVKDMAMINVNVIVIIVSEKEN
jgi:hypothetical protein